MLLLVCTYIISSKRVHHVTTYLIHGVPTRLSVSRVENRVYMYYAAPFYRSASNQESSPFPSPPLPSCLAPSLSCSSSQLSVSFFFFIRSFVQAFSLSLFFFYDLSTFSSFSFLSNYLSLLDLFPSHRSYFRVRFLPLFSLSYSSFFVCFRSLSFFCTSSSIFYSLFLWLQERGTEASVLPFDIFKKFFSYQFSISFFFSIALYALHLTLYLFDFFL